MIKTRTWCMIIAAVLLISAAAWFYLSRRQAPGLIANIYLDGECVRSIDLESVEEPFSFTVEHGDGVNVIEVEHGRIRVASSNCPDQICVDDGWLSSDAVPIVCLPHRLVIELDDESHASTDVDSVSR